MISDKLYQLAFEYKKTKLWKTLWDTDIFAVKLPDSQIGYVCIMGAAGDYLALGVYIGSKGLSSFMRTAATDPLTLPPLKYHECLLQQDCLQCTFENKDELTEEEREEAKKYARAHGIRIAGRRAYPQFKKYTPNCLPWPLQTEKEQAVLCDALAAAIEISRLLEKDPPEALGFGRSSADPPEIPLLGYQNGRYILEKTVLPPESPVEIPTPTAGNDVGIARIKKFKKTGIWECDIIRFPQPVQNTPEEIPSFPLLLLAVESSTGYVLHVPPVQNYEEDPEHLMNLFIEALMDEKVCPIKIKVCDERTYAFAKPLCDRLKIALSMEGDLPALEDAEHDFMMHFSMNESEQLDNLHEMLDSLLQLDEGQLRTLPDELVALLKMLAEQGDLPKDLEEKLDAFFSPKPSGPPHSYVISVSLGTGCYRHIQIAGGSTLFDLHAAILDAFGFIDDHAHAFFMDNKSWSEWDSYYAAGIEEDCERTTDRYTLDRAGLHKGMRFKYIFDFGDEWTFQCKVLRITEGDAASPLILKSKGEAPDQYGCWDDDGWDDD